MRKQAVNEQLIELNTKLNVVTNNLRRLMNTVTYKPNQENQQSSELCTVCKLLPNGRRFFIQDLKLLSVHMVEQSIEYSGYVFPLEYCPSCGRKIEVEE